MLNLEQCTVSEPVKRMLDTMFVQKRVPQALIIEGDHTKTTELARVLASGLVCRSQDNKPCGTQQNFYGAASASFGSQYKFFFFYFKCHSSNETRIACPPNTRKCKNKILSAGT